MSLRSADIPELRGDRLVLYVQKKSLSLAQNLENKGLEFFFPSRSMVLKVVTGKIFKTWKLQQQLTARGSILGTGTRTGPEAFAVAVIWGSAVKVQ
jgi:hypothetical protein